MCCPGAVLAAVAGVLVRPRLDPRFVRLQTMLVIGFAGAVFASARADGVLLVGGRPTLMSVLLKLSALVVRPVASASVADVRSGFTVARGASKPMDHRVTVRHHVDRLFASEPRPREDVRADHGRRPAAARPGERRRSNRAGRATDQAMVPVQALPTERWPDGSIRWALLDFQAIGIVAADRRYHLTFDGGSDGVACAASDDHRSGRADRRRHRRRAIPAAGRGRLSVRGGDRRRRGRPIDAAEQRVRRHRRQAGHRGARASRRSRSRSAATVRSSVRLDGFVGPRRRPLLQVIARRPLLRRVGGGARRRHAAQSAPSAAPRRVLGAGRSRIGHLRDASLHVALPSSVTALECAPERGLMPQRFDRAVRALPGFERRRALAALRRT